MVDVRLRVVWAQTLMVGAASRISPRIGVFRKPSPLRWPTGLFFQATAFRRTVTGVLKGFALFYNVRRT